MARCPAGHESQANDYCDTCGLVIGGESASAAATPFVAAATSRAAAGSSGAAAAAPSAGGGGAGSGCPVCQAERNGRFCEECGYDFDLAEAMPHVAMTPGVLPASSEQRSSGPSVPEVSTNSGVSTSLGASVGSEGPEASEPTGESSGAGGSGLDLDAEIARAEAEAAAVAAGGSEAPANVEVARESQQVSESAASSVAGSGPETSPDPDSALPVTPPPLSEPTSGLSALSVSGLGSLEQEISLVVNADRDYYKAQVERGDIIESEFPFPKYPSERRFTFADGPVRVGRASASRGLSPEIDLTGPPLDPAVSHLHAQLLRHTEGWVVVDLDSANGTRLNDAEEPLEAETEIPVKSGDRIHLGVWTTITVE